MGGLVDSEGGQLKHLILLVSLVTSMLNNLLESCLKQFEPLTQNHFELVEPLETYNLIKTLFMESCPSLIPPAE